MTRPIQPRRPTRALPLLAALAIGLAACGSSDPTVSPSTSAPTATPPPATSAPPSTAPTPVASGEEAAIYDAIEAQVLELRGLPPVDVDRQTIDAAALKAKNAAYFDQDNPADYIAGNERLLKALGVLPEEQTLRDTFLDLIDSQVAGFYRPDEKALYVVSRSGSINGADKITFAHEYVHALQDAHSTIFQNPEELRDESDRALARAAVYEGDATLLMSLWAIPNLTPEELQEVVAAGTDPEATAVLQRTPAFLVESLLFPYNTGLTFLQPIQTQGGWEAVDAIYDRLPTSTEQVIHPDKYDANEEPVAVALPGGLATDMGSGWKVSYEDTFGEFQFGVWLREAGVDATTAGRAAAGWGGDRLALLSGPEDRWALVMATTWDSAAEAREFQAAAGTAVGDGPHAGTVIVDGRDVAIIVASDGETLDAAVSAAGFGGG